MQRLKPTNDFIFKKLFGEEGEEIDIGVSCILKELRRGKITSSYPKSLPLI
ncbi:MAG: hypothetical protein RSD98_07930 [Niameybacter sp.]